MKKICNFIKNIVVWAILAASVGMMIFTIFSVTTFDQNNRSVFGYKFFIVRSDSMSATDFDAGDIIFVKEVDPATLQEGDIIAYLSQDSSSFGETITHKIRRRTTNGEGEPGFVTYGTTTDTDDEMVVTYAYVLGKYSGKLSNVGTFFTFLKTTEGYILCILIPFLLLIGYNGLNCVILFRRYKKEQMEELMEEREKIEEERRQAAEMMKEIQELRSQLANQKDEQEAENAEQERNAETEEHCEP